MKRSIRIAPRRSLFPVGPPSAQAECVLEPGQFNLVIRSMTSPNGAPRIRFEYPDEGRRLRSGHGVWHVAN
jgi:hypothetical protein